jgi:hypothetical protein
MKLLRYRLAPRGLVAFAVCACAQHRNLNSPWPKAVRTAWFYGPVR